MGRKIELNESIGLHLKEFRTKYQVKAKEVAEEIGKSAAYISKLEKGQIQQIEKAELVRIANFISKSNEGYYLFCEKIAEQANIEELQTNILLLNFDYVERVIPINEDLINEIKNRMVALGISSQELAIYINQNEEIDAEFLMEHRIIASETERNVWIPYYEADAIENPRCFALLEYEGKRIEELINGEIHKCEYMFPYAILYHLIKLECKKEGKVLDDDLRVRCQHEASEILVRCKFYLLSMQAKLKEQSNSEEEYTKLLNKFDVDNKEYISEILTGIHFLSKFDIDYTNEKLDQIVKNFKQGDLSFSLAFMAIPLVEMKELQPSLKKKFLNEVIELVEKYVSMATTSDNVEKY